MGQYKLIKFFCEISTDGDFSFKLIPPCMRMDFDKENESINIYACSEESCDTELTFSYDNIGRYEIKRSLSSVRIVDLQEKIE